MGDGAITPAENTMLTGVSSKFTSQLEGRRAKFKFMWMNLGIETGFKDLFEVAQMPSAVVFNPHKRLRFTKLDHGEDNDIKGDESSLSTLMDKVLGGDARFTPVKGQKLPAWAVREQKHPKMPRRSCEEESRETRNKGLMLSGPNESG